MKDNLPFFSHDNNARNHPKMKALIAEFGYEGYGRFWAMNEKIAESAGAFIDISRKVYKLDLAKELGLDGDGLDKFLAFLSDPEIDLINLQNDIITTDRITELYSQTMEKREEARNKKREKKGKDDFPEGKGDFPEGIQVENADLPAENNTYNTIQDNTKLDKTKQNSCGSTEPPLQNQPVQKPKKPPLREREPVNDLERVEKAYLQNWDMLYSRKLVMSPEPTVTWEKTRRLLNQHFVKLKPEQIIYALKNGMEDSLVMLNAYSLSFMLTDTHLNRLINKPPSTSPPKHKIAADNIPQEELDQYFS